jgi:hypothetical protein
MLVRRLEVGLEINIEKTKYMLLSCHQNAGQNRDVKQIVLICHSSSILE